MIRWSLIALLGISLAAAFLWLTPRIYRPWKYKRLVQQAQDAFAREDTRSAALAAQQALAGNPAGIEAYRIMAALAERFGSSDAVIWRQQVLKLAPNDVQARLELATAAVRFGHYRLAGDLLKSIVGGEADTLAYHQSAAALAIAVRNYAQAEFHLSKAAKLDSSNLQVALNLAVLGLGSTDVKVASEARAALEKVPEDSPMRVEALRSLVNEALARKDGQRAVKISQELLAHRGASFSDHLLLLSVLRAIGSEDLQKEITALGTKAQADAEDCYAYWNWLWRNEMYSQASAWVKALPATMQKAQPVPIAMAEVYAHERTWADMLNDFNRDHWGRLDFLRMAFITRALREQNRDLAAREQWHAAMRAASEGAISLSMLAEKVGSWGWKPEVEQLLWITADRFPWQVSSLDSLYRIYYAAGNTEGLLKVFRRMHLLDPADPVTANNLAALIALHSKDYTEAFALASQVYSKHPTVPTFISTYAYLLHLRGHTDEGLKLLATLPPEELKTPTRALYYGIMLQAKGETTASGFLDIAERGRLLPEEQALLKSARTAPGGLQK